MNSDEKVDKMFWELTNEFLEKHPCSSFMEFGYLEEGTEWHTLVRFLLRKIVEAENK